MPEKMFLLGNTYLSYKLLQILLAFQVPVVEINVMGMP